MVKHSLTEISRCFSARSVAVKRTIFLTGLMAGFTSAVPARFRAPEGAAFLMSRFSACAIASRSSPCPRERKFAENLTARSPGKDLGTLIRCGGASAIHLHRTQRQRT